MRRSPIEKLHTRFAVSTERAMIHHGCGSSNCSTSVCAREQWNLDSSVRKIGSWQPLLYTFYWRKGSCTCYYLALFSQNGKSTLLAVEMQLSWACSWYSQRGNVHLPMTSLPCRVSRARTCLHMKKV